MLAVLGVAASYCGRPSWQRRTASATTWSLRVAPPSIFFARSCCHCYTHGGSSQRANIVMLLDLPDEEARPRFGKHWPFAAAVGLGFASLAWLARAGAGLAPASTRAATTVPFRGNLSAVGMALFGPFTLPFEIASLLLLAAIIGAVVLARRRTAGP